MQYPPSVSGAPAEARPPDIKMIQQVCLQPPKSLTWGALSEEVRAHVTRRVQQLPLLGPYTTDMSSDEEPGTVSAGCRKTYLKSGRLHTTDSQVLHTVDWPHMHVYSADGKPAEYESLTVPLLVARYVPIMEARPMISEPSCPHTW